MKTTCLALLVLLAACSNASGPPGLDPIVLAKNNQSTYPASITWWDQSGQVQQTVLPGASTTCVKFTATNLADSVRFEIVVGDTTSTTTEWYKQWSPWFDPKTGLSSQPGVYPNGAEFWTLNIPASNPGATVLTVVASAPC